MRSKLKGLPVVRSGIVQVQFDCTVAEDRVLSRFLPIIDGGGDGNPYILPQYAMMGGGADMGSEDVEEKNLPVSGCPL